MTTTLSQVIKQILDAPADELDSISSLLYRLTNESKESKYRDWSFELKKFMSQEICWGNNLQLAGTVDTPKHTQKFIAKNNFLTDRKLLRISHISRVFKSRFLDKVEHPLSETTLCYGRVLKPSTDTSIIEQIGNNAVETTLTEMFYHMKKQGQIRGQSGALLVEDRAINLFFIRDINNELCDVTVSWYGDGWNLDAKFGSEHPWACKEPHKWDTDTRVFYRSSM